MFSLQSALGNPVYEHPQQDKLDLREVKESYDVYIQRIVHLSKSSGRCITQLAKVSIDPESVKLTADVLRTML